jgi:hypothetical protein
MERTIVHYLPLVTTGVAAAFAVVLFRHWRARPSAKYLMWWTAGVVAFGLGTLAESVTTVFGWSEPVFRLWYISGALLGGVLLAQGVVYLLASQRTADRLTRILLVYLTVAAVIILFVPVDAAAADPYRLSGDVIEWDWVPLLTPLVNLYAMLWLVGGAIWSALRYYRNDEGTARRVWGNAAIAAAVILIGIGGAFARADRVEVHYVTALVGLILIWVGYRIIVTDPGPSIHSTPEAATELTVDLRAQHLRAESENGAVVKPVEGSGADS